MATNNAGNTYIVPTTANEVTKPSQPAFLARGGAQDANVTGNGTLYTLGQGNVMVEIFDQNTDFDIGGGGGSGQSTLTAPVTGRYQLDVILAIKNNENSTREEFSLVTSNFTYAEYGLPNQATSGNNDANINISILAEMDAADTAYVTYMCDGEGADTSDIGNTPQLWFSGYLAV